jgi:UDP-N-acetylmuramate: L-alanyl-gamma-D-glutamyl-meso-diaminopimelate ligase
MAKHIHMIGICGSAMASLAGMLETKGYRITGSDAAAYPPMSDLLASLGIPIMEPYAEANLSPQACSINAYPFVRLPKLSSTNFFPAETRW